MTISSSSAIICEANPITLAFKEKSIEAKYLETYRQSSIDTILSYVPWGAIILMGGFGAFFILFPELEAVKYIFALGMVTLLILHVQFYYIPPSYRLLEIHLALITIIFGWLDSALLILYPFLNEYVYAIIAVHIVSTSLAMPVRFLSAIIYQTLMFCGFAFIAFTQSELSTVIAFFQSLFLIGIIGFCFFSAYHREKASRENFIKQETISAYSNALHAELEKGRKIQKDFLPTRIPQIQNCDIAAYFHPALQLSGDFYDVFTLPDNRVGLVIADVSDKGVGSALFMALLRSLIRVFSGHSALHASSDDHATGDSMTMKTFGDSKHFDTISSLNAVSLTNEYIAHEHGEEGMFATLFFGVIDPSTGLLSYINGGHEPLILVSADGIEKRLKPTGPAVGMMPGSSYRIEEIKLDPGDILFGYTDGVTEARSPSDELYSRRRLEQSVINSSLTDATSFSDSIKSDLFKFIEQAPQSDDITMLTLRWG